MATSSLCDCCLSSRICYRQIAMQPVSSLSVPSQGPSDDHDYLAREARARLEIDRQLVAAGWSVQSQESLNLSAGPGVAVREFTLEKPHGRVDYLLFLNGQPAGVIEAKPEGMTLTEVEHQSGKYVAGLPDWMQPTVYPLPFIYESTGAETRFTNGYDPDARSRRVFTFHRPETLAEWLRQIADNPERCPHRHHQPPRRFARRPRHAHQSRRTHSHAGVMTEQMAPAGGLRLRDRGDSQRPYGGRP